MSTKLEVICLAETEISKDIGRGENVKNCSFECLTLLYHFWSLFT
jgi:hypothetical protein